MEVLDLGFMPPPLGLLDGGLGVTNGVEGKRWDLCFVVLCSSGASNAGAALLSRGATAPGVSGVRVLVGDNTFSVSVGLLAPLGPYTAPVVMAPLP